MTSDRTDEMFSASESVHDMIDLTLSDSDDGFAAVYNDNDIDDNEVVIRVFSFIKDDDVSLEGKLFSTSVQGQISLIQNEEDFNKIFERPHSEQVTDCEQGISNDVHSDTDIIVEKSEFCSSENHEVPQGYVDLNRKAKLITNGVDKDVSEGRDSHSPKNEGITYSHTTLNGNEVEKEIDNLEQREMSAVLTDSGNVSMTNDTTSGTDLLQQSISLETICIKEKGNLKENRIHEECLSLKCDEQSLLSDFISVNYVEHKTPEIFFASDSNSITNQRIQSKCRPFKDDMTGTINNKKSTTPKGYKQNDEGYYQHTHRYNSLEDNSVLSVKDLRKYYSREECHRDHSIIYDQIQSHHMTNMDNDIVNCNRQQSANKLFPALVRKDEPVKCSQLQSLLEVHDNESDEVIINQEKTPVLHPCGTSKAQDFFNPQNQLVNHQPQMTQYIHPQEHYLHVPTQQFSLLNEQVRPGCCTVTNSRYTTTNGQMSLPGIGIFLTQLDATPAFATLSSGNLRPLYCTNNNAHNAQQFPQTGCYPSSFNLVPEVVHSRSPQTLQYTSSSHRSHRASNDLYPQHSIKTNESTTLIGKSSSQNADYSMNLKVYKVNDKLSNSDNGQNNTSLPSWNQSVPEMSMSGRSQTLSDNMDMECLGVEATVNTAALNVLSPVTSQTLASGSLNSNLPSKERDIGVMKSYYTQDTPIAYSNDLVANIHWDEFPKERNYADDDQRKQLDFSKGRSSEQPSEQPVIDICVQSKRKSNDGGTVSQNSQPSPAIAKRDTSVTTTTKRKPAKDVQVYNSSISKLTSQKEKNTNKPKLSVDELGHTNTVLDTDKPNKCITKCFILNQNQTERGDAECSEKMMKRTSRCDPEQKSLFAVDGSVTAGTKKSTGVNEKARLTSCRHSTRKDVTAGTAQSENKASELFSQKHISTLFNKRSNESQQQVPERSKGVRDTIWTIIKERNQPENSTESADAQFRIKFTRIRNGPCDMLSDSPTKIRRIGNETRTVSCMDYDTSLSGSSAVCVTRVQPQHGKASHGKCITDILHEHSAEYTSTVTSTEKVKSTRNSDASQGENANSLFGGNVNAEHISSRKSLKKSGSVPGFVSYSAAKRRRLPLLSSSTQTSDNEMSGQTTSVDRPKIKRSKVGQRDSAYPNKEVKYPKNVTNTHEKIKSKVKDTQTQEKSCLNDRLYPLYKSAKEEVLSKSRNKVHRHRGHTSVAMSVTNQCASASAGSSWELQSSECEDNTEMCPPTDLFHKTIKLIVIDFRNKVPGLEAHECHRTMIALEMGQGPSRSPSTYYIRDHVP